MIYRDFGKTREKISSLGFGCMRLPMVRDGAKEIVDQDKVTAMLRRAYALGVNYFDTAYFYNDGLSEIAVGKALRGLRDKVLVSTKSPGHLVKKPGDYRRILEEQLKKLDMSYIDFYHFHGIGYDGFLEIEKNASWHGEALKAKAEGLIRHISFSFHDKSEAMIKLVDLGLFESVLCQYSAVDRSNGAAIAHAHAKGLGVAIMGPLGGGRVSGLPVDVAQRLGIKVKSSVELGMRFVFANPCVDCALSGMETMAMLEENAAISARRDGLNPSESEAIAGLMAENEKLSDLYCTGCGYCLPCPAEVNIPHIFKMMNYWRVYGIREYAQRGYAEIGTNPWVKGARADACTDCGQCEEKCPQKIRIREQLKESHTVLSADQV